jgi:hypothetical protein
MDPFEQLVVRFDSWRAVSAGNRADRNLATKSTHGGRAIWQAVTRVKLEQTSNAAMWTPTRRKIGEGVAGREAGAQFEVQRPVSGAGCDVANPDALRCGNRGFFLKSTRRESGTLAPGARLEIEIVLAKLSLLFKVAVPPLLQLPAKPTENK